MKINFNSPVVFDLNKSKQTKLPILLELCDYISELPSNIVTVNGYDSLGNAFNPLRKKLFSVPQGRGGGGFHPQPPFDSSENW